MVGYVLNKIQISNFKYATCEKPINIDFNRSNIVILDGQNGYGKTTLFDAIELLITGKLHHFNDQLLNKGKESIGILANNPNKDIVITGLLYSEKRGDVELKRIFKCDKDFFDTVIWNEETISQEELYIRLEMKENLFHIGMYISQSQSLDFLQNKYKERKEKVSQLLENQEITHKLNLMKDTFQVLKDMVGEEKNKLKLKTESIGNKINELEVQSKQLEIINGNYHEEVKLFPNKDYEFDSDNVNLEISFKTVKKPLEQLKEFIADYNEYEKAKENQCIDKLLSIPQQMYMKFYYQKEVELIQSNIAVITRLERCQDLIEKLNNKEWKVDKELLELANVSLNDIALFESKVQLLENLKNNLSASEKTIIAIEELRKNLIIQFNIATGRGVIKADICPLCGTKLADIQKAFNESENALKECYAESIQRKNEIETQIDSICKSDIISKLEEYLGKNRNLLTCYQELKTCKDLDVSEVRALFEKLEITGFNSSNVNEFNIEEFERNFIVLQEKLKNSKRVMKALIPQEKMTIYESIHLKYYDNKKPNHTVEDIDLKINNLAKKYSDDIAKQLSVELQNKKIANEEFSNYELSADRLLASMDTLVKKYNDANKEYQSALANAIRLPLIIYSGKIIQNYPLGLGIDAKIKTNQLVFESAEKPDVDVYNILSTGQLNGLAIAILLSVNSVFGKPEGLNMMLIDDPLQTIDEISAISLADILTQQNIGQVIVSTHEEEKAKMLRYKFEQKNLTVCEKNMQNIYLQSQGI